MQPYIRIHYTEILAPAMLECRIVILAKSFRRFILDDADRRGCQLKRLPFRDIAGNDHFFQPTSCTAAVDIPQQLLDQAGLAVTDDGDGNVRTQVVYLALFLGRIATW